MVQSSFLRLPTVFALLWHGKVADAFLPNYSLGRVGSLHTCSQSRATPVQHRAAGDLHMSSQPPRMEPLWDTSDELNRVLENNKRWADNCIRQDPQFFSRMTSGQSPNFLWIGCADSRVPAQDITGLKAGEMFVHRNVANLVINSDLNLLTVLTYAVEVLGVKDIIVCGHYKCGGCAAGMTNNDFGPLEHWVRNVRDVYAKHFDELDAIKDEEKKQRRLVELNVIESCMKLYTLPTIQRKQANTRSFPRIHGLVYDIADGSLKKLPINFDSRHAKKLNKMYRSVYRVNELDGK